MPSLLIPERYTEKQKNEILKVFLTPSNQNLPRYISARSEEFLSQISRQVTFFHTLYSKPKFTGADYRDKGILIAKQARQLKKSIEKTDKEMFDSVDILADYILSSDTSFTDIKALFPGSGKPKLNLIIRFVKFLEEVGEQLETRAIVTKGQYLAYERSLIQNLEIAWCRVFEKKPSTRRDSHFHKLASKIFELEGLGIVSERLLKSALDEMYTLREKNSKKGRTQR